jgi:hypothetical protein
MKMSPAVLKLNYQTITCGKILKKKMKKRKRKKEETYILSSGPIHFQVSLLLISQTQSQPNQQKILNSNPNNQRWLAWKLNAQNLGPIALAMYSNIGMSWTKKDTHAYQSSLVSVACVNAQTRRLFNLIL